MPRKSQKLSRVLQQGHRPRIWAYFFHFVSLLLPNRLLRGGLWGLGVKSRIFQPQTFKKNVSRYFHCCLISFRPRLKLKVCDGGYQFTSKRVRNRLRVPSLYHANQGRMTDDFYLVSTAVVPLPQTVYSKSRSLYAILDKDIALKLDKVILYSLIRAYKDTIGLIVSIPPEL